MGSAAPLHVWHRTSRGRCAVFATSSRVLPHRGKDLHSSPCSRKAASYEIATIPPNMSLALCGPLSTAPAAGSGERALHGDSRWYQRRRYPHVLREGKAVQVRLHESPGHAQRFLAAYGPIAQRFRPRRHRFAASAYRREMRQRFETWQDITSLPTAA
jgi:hypothetical protein